MKPPSEMGVSLAVLPNGMPTLALPKSVAEQGPAAQFAWDEFFGGRIRNRHTRTAYRRAVLRFLKWIEARDVSLPAITPGQVGTYFDAFPGSPPTRKLHLAALRAFFDVLVERHVVVLNPAASVRGERYSAVEGKTPEITPEQVRQLLTSIDVMTPIGLRDRAIIATLIFTAARAGAIAALRMKHLVSDSTQQVLQFAEKGGVAREIPVRHDLQGFLAAYIAGLPNPENGKAAGNLPLFRTIPGRNSGFTINPMTGVDIYRMIARRLLAVGLSRRLSPHSFRVCAVTDLLSQGVALEDVQYLAGHADPRTTRLYDRRQKKVTRNIVERISI